MSKLIKYVEIKKFKGFIWVLRKTTNKRKKTFHQR